MRIYGEIAVVLAAALFAACRNRLDLSPQGQASDPELFRTGEGCRSVLSGIYKGCAWFALPSGSGGRKGGCSVCTSVRMLP